MYGSLTKVLMGDLTEKYICMVEVGDVIFPTNVVWCYKVGSFDPTFILRGIK